MSTDTGSNGTPPVEERITLTKEDDWWVAKDEGTGVASQGKTRTEALKNLDEAVALYNGEVGESIDSWEEEKEVLEDLGLDPEEVKANREAADGLPEFMQ
ncbi:type II toxin-antitoxin system HicB family antitoxin [Natrinema salsiterrestre]|uniref:Type II toxin-antitoxin system HicB family antitoxin n=1 Tax=Natrinema salsiterrestre TaxID=2950540 RepID=A0A9Q4Q1T7_9EURY|nr:type II toxin-antitoxin system HicB family antitoxin [Natrinema salsiterrestre]MDF9748410.1 type II toxin-antitoxin system HicB family antitoxin [Natrinema salsiterrestre]